MVEKVKLNLGAGNDIKDGYINHDIAEITGIDVIHDLNTTPWPWESEKFEKVIAIDVLEHLDNFFEVMEELHRITKENGTIEIKVPYWNSSFCHMDPTHKQLFHEMTFHFLDPDKDLCQSRNYYTNARFKIIKEEFVLMPFAPYFRIPFLKPIKVKRKLSKRIVGFFGNLFSNIILDLEIELQKV